VNWEKRDVKELKPDSPRAVRRGERQLEGYKQEVVARILREFGFMGGQDAESPVAETGAWVRSGADLARRWFKLPSS
jgi:hypothetical protein